MDTQEMGRSLLEAFATVPDHRSRHGRRHPLPALLALATAAMLSNARSLYAIAQWGRTQAAATLQALGFTRAQAPCVATLHLVFKGLHVAALEAALAGWTQAQRGEGPEAIAVDGKTLRGSREGTASGVQVVAAYADRLGMVLAQRGDTGR